MKEKNLLKPLTFALILIIIVIILLCVVGNTNAKYKEITEVSLSRYGTIVGLHDEYTLTFEDGVWVATYCNKEFYVDEEFANNVIKTLQKNQVHRWDGFNKEFREMTDGEKFKFYMCFSDGTTVEASGYERFPFNFRPVLEAFEKQYEVLLENE